MDWFFADGRKPILALVCVVTGFFAVHAARVGVESDNVSMDALDGHASVEHRAFVREFGDDEDLFVALTFDSGLSVAAVDDIAEFTEAIEDVAGVRRVLSIVTAPRIVRGQVGAQVEPWFDNSVEGSEGDGAFAAAILAEPAYAGVLVSYDRNSAGVIVQLDNESADGTERGHILESVRAVANRWSSRGVRARVVGIGAQKYEVARLVSRDQAILVPAAVAVLGIVLFWFGRTLTSAILPLVVTGISLCWTLGLLRVTGFELNAITSLLPPVVMVLSVATSVHLYYGWVEAVVEPSAESRSRAVLKRLWRPCALTAVTTALGLLALCSSGTPAVQQFGAFAAFGVLVSFVVGIIVVPLWLADTNVPVESRGVRDGLVSILSNCSRFALASPPLVVFIAVIFVGVAVYGVTLVRSNTDLVRFLRSGSELRQDTEFVDREFAGTMSLELIVSADDDRPLIGPDDVLRMALLRDSIVQQSGFRHVTTILDVLEPLNRAERPGAGAVLPDDPMELAYLFDLLAYSADSDFLRRFATPEFGKLRITLRGPAIGSAEATQSVAGIEAQAREIFSEGYRVVSTGTFYRLAQESDRIVEDQVRSFVLAFVMVAVAIGFAFRSWRLLAASMLPNLVPIVGAVGLMGFLGIDLSTGTAMVASVVIGIAVDDTIHYLSRFRLAYRDDARVAVCEANTGAGIAMTVTSVVLVLGFWVGVLGSFKPTIYFSLLSGATMLVGLFCDLIVLPACLVLAYRNPPRRTVP